MANEAEPAASSLSYSAPPCICYLEHCQPRDASVITGQASCSLVPLSFLSCTRPRSPTDGGAPSGEPVRLTLAALELPWQEVHYGSWNEDKEGLVNIDWGPELKSDLDLFEFAQAPR